MSGPENGDNRQPAASDQATGRSVTLSVTDRLALERTRIAYERTLMAWIRTATSLISFGFAIYKFFQLDLSARSINYVLIGPREFAIGMIAIGLMGLIFGTAQYRRDMRFLRKHYPDMPWTMTGIGVILLGVLGLLALVAVILRS